MSPYKRIIPPAMLTLLLFLVIPPGCGKRIVELKKEKLFSVPIGSGAEEIGVVNENQGNFVGPRQVLFRNGFFYVIDEVNQKIMKITTPGDIILILADGTGETEPGDSVLKTKERKQYDFNHIGRITVDSENSIYVEDRSLVSKSADSSIDIIGFGEEEGGGDEGTMQSHVLKFDRLGNYLYSIGRQGRGGEAFNYIFNMEIDSESHLVVLTTDENWENWTYYVYDRTGNLLYTTSLTMEDFLDSPSDETQTSLVLDIVPTVDPYDVVCWTSEYDTTHDTKEGEKKEDVWSEEIEMENNGSFKTDQGSARDYVQDLLYYKLLYVDVKTGDLLGTHVWETRPLESTDTTEEFIGIDGKMNGFLWKYVDNTRSIVTIFRPDGSMVAKRSFVFEDNGIWTNLNVSVDGTVTSVKIDNKRVQFYRWRSDKLFGNTKEKQSLWEFIRGKIEEFKNANR
jgi:hypothetical protein